ncbi:hypothetical protein F5X98DRAFT_353236 [Xylaria grammica]|nr:hypothetical protein F5X98DRAFT_353236 [Xylaria grammica]
MIAVAILLFITDSRVQFALGDDCSFTCAYVPNSRFWAANLGNIRPSHMIGYPANNRIDTSQNQERSRLGLFRVF